MADQTINLQWLWWHCRMTEVRSSSSDRPWIQTLNFSCVVPGVQARAVSPEDPPTLPRHRICSDGQYQSGPDDEPSADVPLRSPVRCVSPEFVNAIAMNPGGRPKEVESVTFWTYVVGLRTPVLFSPLFSLRVDVCFCSTPQRNMHSYREAFEEMDGGTISPTPIVGGEVFPQTPAFPVSPQTPYFNLCKSPSGWQRALWSSGLLRIETKRHSILTEGSMWKRDHSYSEISFYSYIYEPSLLNSLVS